MSKKIRLTEYARLLTITRQTALNWYHQGKLPHPAERISDRIILVEVPDDFDGTIKEPEPEVNKTIAYMRVSTRKQITSIPNQKLAILDYANQNNLHIDEFIEEIGSGFNENRRKLLRVLKDPSIKTIIVEHRDRIARSNFNLLKATLEATGRTIIVVNPLEEGTELVTEITEFMVSKCGQIYGSRGAERVKQQLEQNNAELSQGDNHE